MSLLSAIAELSPDQYRFVQRVKIQLGWHASDELVMVLNGETHDFPTLHPSVVKTIREWAVEENIKI